VSLQCTTLVTTWPKKETPQHLRRTAPFSANYDTLWRDLDRELDYLRARDAVAEFDMPTTSFRRLDTRPFADAPRRTPKVLLYFQKGDLGRLVFACDKYLTWSGNLRAISLTLTALRAVDRYEATSGEQYKGFRALPPGGGSNDGAAPEPPMTAEDAARALVEADPVSRSMPAEAIASLTANVLAHSHIARIMAGTALKATHPDSGTGGEPFHRVQRAREVLTAHFGGTL
jgi:hypothetical protein